MSGSEDLVTEFMASYADAAERMLPLNWIEYDDETATDWRSCRVSGSEGALACRDGLAVREIIMQYSGETLITMVRN